MSDLIMRFLLVLFLLSSGTALYSEESVKVRDFTYKTQVRVTAFAQEAEKITNPLRYPQITDIASDGSFVNKGDVITRFELEGLHEKLHNLELRENLVQARLEKRLTGIRNKNMDLKDQLEARKDRLAVLQAQLNRLKTLPDNDEVAIHLGRLKVARLELAAAAKDLERAEDRYGRKMISETELDKARRRFREKEAAAEKAQKHYEYANQPAKKWDVRRVEIQIENTQMEVKKLTHEISENRQISEIEKKGARSSTKLIEKRIKECKDEIKQSRIRAPISGYVMYERRFKERVLRSGSKMWKKFVYMKIPDQKSLAFKGVILESCRQYFQENDMALIRIIGRDDAPLKGKITSIGKIPHDRGEKDKGYSRDKTESGIKVFDITVELDNQPEWLKIGMHASCELISGKKLRGPSVPARFVREEGGRFYISVDHVFQLVTGAFINGFFLLNETTWTGTDVHLYGEFEKDTKDDSEDTIHNFRAYGELVPIDTQDVRVDRIYGWQKVAWLIDEDAHVEPDEVVAKLETKEVDDEIEKWETLVQEAVGQRETFEEQIELNRRENAYQLKRNLNLLELSELELEKIKKDRNWSAIYDAQLSVRMARIHLEYTGKRLNTMKGRRKEFVSPVELNQLKRSKKEAALRLETAQLRLKGLTEGPDRVAVKQKELAYLDQKLKVETLRRQIAFDTFRDNRTLENKKRHERYRRKRLERRKKQRERLVLKAPRAGIVQYRKVWSSGSLAKISVGTPVGYRFVLMKIADTSRMYVRVEVPEQYYPHIRKGLDVQVKIPSITDQILAGKVTDIEFLFQSKRKKDTKAGLYSSYEALGETVFFVRINLAEQKGVSLKPGVVAQIIFPFGR